MNSRRIYGSISMALALTLAACGIAETSAPITIVETVEVTVAPEATPLAIPFLEQWQDSEHADADDTSPNFFIDLNADGEPDPDEKWSGNKYQTWTPRLLPAAFNYHTIYQDDGG
jgi:hypothetical protein